MTDQYIPALRQRFLEDMQIKGLQPKTQTMYLRGMRGFTRFLGHSPDTATPEELRAFQLDMKERGVGAPTFNNRLTVLSFFFAATYPRPEMKRHMRYQRAAKKIPVVLSAEEVARILEAAPGTGLRCRAAFSVAYGGGLRASKLTHLKVGDIDSDRMLIRIEQGKRILAMAPSLKTYVMLSLAYGCGLRKGESVQLKVGDIVSAQEIIRTVQANADNVTFFFDRAHDCFLTTDQTSLTAPISFRKHI